MTSDNPNCASMSNNVDIQRFRAIKDAERCHHNVNTLHKSEPIVEKPSPHPLFVVVVELTATRHDGRCSSPRCFACSCFKWFDETHQTT